MTIKPYKRLLAPDYLAQQNGCTCRIEPDHQYWLGFTDCWELFLEWRVKVKDADYGSTADYMAKEALKNCPVHGKPMQVEPVPDDYPWTPEDYVRMVQL